MKKNILLDATFIDPTNNKTETLNVVISEKKIIGLGYVPDDEDGKKINLKGSYLLHGITDIATNEKKIQNPHSHGVFCGHPEKTNFITTTDLQNPEELTKLFTTVKPPLIITPLKGYELEYIIQEANKHSINLHVIITDINNTLPLIKEKKKTSKNITASILCPLLLDIAPNKLLSYIEDKTIDCISAGESQLDMLIPLTFTILKPHLSWIKITELLSTIPQKICNNQLSPIAVNQDSKITVLSPSKSDTITDYDSLYTVQTYI